MAPSRKYIRMFALPRDCDFRSNIQNAAFRFFKLRQREVRHVVVMKKIEPQRTHKFFRAAVLQSHIVIRTHIVHKHVQPTILLQRLLDRRAAALDRQNVCEDQAARCSTGHQLRLQPLTCFDVLIDNHSNGALARAAARNCLSDSFSAAGNQHNLVFKLQVHGAPPLRRKIELRFHRKCLPYAPAHANSRIPQPPLSRVHNFPPKGTLANPTQTSSAPAQTPRTQHPDRATSLPPSSATNPLRWQVRTPCKAHWCFARSRACRTPTAPGSRP